MSIVDNKNVEDRYVIQILRAIAICLVVFHHSVNALNLPEYMNVSVQIINKIHVNIFFVISGFLFEKKKILYIQNSAKKFVQKKFIQLIIPYFVFSELFSMFIYVGYKIPRIASLMSNFGTKKKFIETIIDVMLFRNMYFESLWFVYTLFIIFILNYILSKSKLDYVNGITLICISIITVIIKANVGDGLWYILNKTITYFVWFYLSRFLQKNGRRDWFVFFQNKTVKAMSLIILVTCIIRYSVVDLKKYMNFWERAYYIQIENYLIALSSIVLIYSISLYLNKKCQNIYKLGDYSYNIYLLHNPWIVSTVSLVLKKVCNYWIVDLITVFVLSILIPCIVSSFMKKYFNTMYCVIFGKGVGLRELKWKRLKKGGLL